MKLIVQSSILSIFCVYMYLEYQAFSNFFPSDPNFSIQILRNPEQKKPCHLTKASEGNDLVELHRVFRSLGYVAIIMLDTRTAGPPFYDFYDNVVYEF